MNSIGIQLRISDLLFAVQKRWKIIASLTFLGFVFGLMLSGMNYVQSAVQSYQIEGSFVINAVNSQGRYSGGSTAPNRTDMTLATDLYDTVYYLLRSDRLLYQIINDQQMLGVSASDIRRGLSISRYNETNIITMKLTWDNSEEGQLLWQAIIDASNELLPEIMQIGHLQVFNEPQTKMISSRSANIKTWMVLPVLGFGAGMGFAVIELLMRPTLINVKDVETVFGLETIGIIPYDTAFFSNKTSLLVADEKSASEVTQNFSAAAYILRNRIGLMEKNHCFYITSTTGQEGRTSVAAHLAVQLSDMERRTLLIDFDYKNPMLGSMFLNNLDYSHSLNALYRGEILISDAITTLTGYLDILPMVMEHNLIYLDSTIIDMISQLRDQYQYIIIDAPPVGKESETLSLNQVANTVLFVARYDTASIPEIQATLEKLDKSGIRILGCIVNGVKTTKNVLFGTAKEEAAGKSKAAAKKKRKKKLAAPKGKKEDIKETDDSRKDLTSKEKSGGQKKTSTAKRKAPAKIKFFEDLPGNEATPGEAPKPAPEMPDIPQNAAPAPETLATPLERKEESCVPATEAPPEPREDACASMPEAIPEAPEPKEEAFVPVADTAPHADQMEPPPSYGDMSDLETANAQPPDTQHDEGAEALDITPQTQTPETDFAGFDIPVLPEPDEPIPANGLILQAGEPADTVQDTLAEESRPVEKKRGLFGRKPKEPKASAKQTAPRPKKAAASKPEPPEAIDGTNDKKTAKPEKVKAAAPKKKKAGIPFWKKTQKEAADPFEQIKSEATVIHKSRNVFEDLMDEGPVVPTGKTDEEMIEELLRMGLDGSWNKSGESDSGEKKPKGGKRNLFDDL